MSSFLKQNRGINVFILYLSVFLILFLSSSFVVMNNIISSFSTIALWILVLICSFSLKQRLPLRLFAVFVLLSCILFLSTIINGENLIVLSKYVFSFFTVMCVVNKFGRENYIKAFIRIMFYLSIVSLVGYLLFIVFPSLSNTMIVNNANNISFSNYYIYVHLTQRNSSFYRNWGMFWEPGGYQIFLCLACMFEARKEKPSFRIISILLITVFTTFSTTGYIGGLLIIFYLLIKSSSMKKMRSLKIGLIGLTTIFVMVFLLNKNYFSSTSDYTVFGKIINFFDKDYQSGRVTSSSIRYYSLVKPLDVFLKNPLFGVGQTKLIDLTYEYTIGMNLCTMINWFAIYGLIFGLILVIGLLKFSKEDTIYKTLFIFLFLFVVTMSENVMHNALIISIVFCGYLVGGVTNENNTHQLL